MRGIVVAVAAILVLSASTCDKTDRTGKPGGSEQAKSPAMPTLALPPSDSTAKDALRQQPMDCRDLLSLA